MKKIVRIFSAVAAALLLSAIPALSEYGATGLSNEYGPSGASEFSGQQLQKDQCLLVAMNCKGDSDSVQQRVEKLRNEIGKGIAVYTQEELDQFNNQLIWLYSEGDNVF